MAAPGKRKARSTAGEPLPARDVVDPARMAVASAFLAPWRWLFHPVFHGMENIPYRRPLLFVGNHTLYGLVDLPLLFDELWKTRRILPRGLADRAHYRIPVWRDFLSAFGAVDGSRENCEALMRAGEAILVFPGGAREVFKARRQKYKLLWKERFGFAKLAIRHNCTVVPFASVGVEDAWEIIFDRDDYLSTPVGRIAKWIGFRDDSLAPLVRGIGPTPIPRPARIYFRIMPPIEPRSCGSGDAGAIELRDRTHDAIERGIAELRREQRQDPEAIRFSTVFGPLDKR